MEHIIPRLISDGATIYEDYAILEINGYTIYIDYYHRTKLYIDVYDGHMLITSHKLKSYDEIYNEISQI